MVGVLPLCLKKRRRMGIANVKQAQAVATAVLQTHIWYLMVSTGHIGRVADSVVATNVVHFVVRLSE